MSEGLKFVGKIPGIDRYEHGSVKQLREAVETVGDIRAVPIVAVMDDDDNRAIVHRVALFNKKMEGNENRGFIEVVSDEYKLIQPRATMINVVNVMAEHMGQDDTVYYILHEPERGHKAYLNVLFDRKWTDPTGSEMYPGIICTIETTGESSVWMEFYGYRQWCSNGAKAPQTIKSSRIPHRGEQEDMDKAIVNFLITCEAGQKRLQEIMEQCYIDEIDERDAWELLGWLPKNVQKQAMDDFVYHSTRKDRLTLYNFATRRVMDFAESMDSQLKYLDLSERILLNVHKSKSDIMAVAR